MTLIVPENVWKVISAFVEPNPFTYLQHGLVCKSSASVFASDALWEPVAPYDIQDHYMAKFCSEANALPRQQQKLLTGLWDDIAVGKSGTPQAHQHLSNHGDKYDSIADEAANNRTLAFPWAIWTGMVMESAFDASPKGGLLRKLPFWADEKFVAGCTALCPFLLTFANKSLKNSPEVVLGALKKDKMAIVWASPALRDNRDFVLRAVRRNPQVLRYLSSELQCDWEVAAAAVETDGASLQGLHAFQNDKRIVLAAINTDPHALKFASHQMQADRLVVFEAVKLDPWTFNYAAEEIKNDRELVLEAVMREGDLLRVASNFRNDRELVQAAVEADGTALQFAGTKLRADRELVETALESDGTALQYAAKELRSDRELVEVAIDTDPEALKFAAPSLQRDKSMIELQKEMFLENRVRSQSIGKLDRKSSMIANSTTSLATMAGLSMKPAAPLSSLTAKSASNSTPDIPQWRKTYTSGI